jgi:hypothetical protein
MPALLNLKTSLVKNYREAHSEIAHPAAQDAGFAPQSILRQPEVDLPYELSPP